MLITVPKVNMHNGQEAVLKMGTRFRCISAGRRFGKTLLAVEWLTLMPGGAIDGKPVAFFAPKYKLLLDVWRSIAFSLNPIIKKANRTENRIELITGGIIDFWTLEDVNAGRGRKYARIVVDEAAHSKNLKEAWERAISPTLTDYQGDAWFISTPSGLNYFYELYNKQKRNKDWSSIQIPTEVNPYISKEELKRYLEEMPDLVYKQEYQAEFVTFGAGLVKPAFIIDGVAPKYPTVLGVDLAISTKTTADWSAIVAMSKDPVTGTIHVIEVDRFRDEFNGVLNRIKAAAARHNPIMIGIEQTQYQAAVVQELLRTTNLPVRGIRPDKDKVTRFAPLLTRYERFMVRHNPSGCPPWFREEILAFPDGQHDDAVDALAYAYHMLNQTTSYYGSINK